MRWLIWIGVALLVWHYFGAADKKPKLSLVDGHLDNPTGGLGGKPPAALPGVSGHKGKLEDMSAGRSSSFVPRADLGPPFKVPPKPRS